MHMVKLILDQKTHYLMTPEHILSKLKTERIMRAWHFFPSLILAILSAVKVLPIFSSEYAKELDENTFVIPIAFFLCFVVIIIIIGIIIEKILQRSNIQYAEYNKQLMNLNS